MRLERELPGFGDQVFSSPALVRRPLNPLEAGLLVQMPMPCRMQLALRPEEDSLISGLAGEIHVLGDQWCN